MDACRRGLHSFGREGVAHIGWPVLPLGCTAFVLSRMR
jgi:hypothetical protein